MFFWRNKNHDDADMASTAKDMLSSPQRNAGEAKPSRPDRKVRNAFMSKPSEQYQARPEDLGNGSPMPPASINRDMLPEMLLSQGQVSLEQIEYAIKRQEESGRFLGEILVENGILNEKSLVTFIVKHCRIPFLSLLDYIVDKSVVPLVPEDICWKYHLLPIDKLGASLTVAMVNPLNQEALHIVRTLCPKYKIKPILCEHKDFEATAAKVFGARKKHDEQTWSHIPFLLEDSPDVNPVVRQRNILAHVGSVKSQPEPGQHKPDSSEATESFRPLEAPLDTETLLNTVFASNSSEQESDKHTSPSPRDIRKTDLRTGQYKADEVVTQFNTIDQLLYEVADVMLDSMHDTYLLLTRKVPFFKGLRPEDVALIYSGESVSVYESGETIYQKNDSGDCFYIVLSGGIEVHTNERCNAELSRGDIFGISVLAGENKRYATAVAASKVSLLALNPDDVRSKLPPEAAIQLLVNITMILSRRLKRLQEESSVPVELHG